MPQTSALATMSVNCGGHGFGHEPTQGKEGVKCMTVSGFCDYFGKLSPCRFCAVSKLLSAKLADDIAPPGNAFSSLTLAGNGQKPI
jgi:hypothetical protein